MDNILIDIWEVGMIGSRRLDDAVGEGRSWDRKKDSDRGKQRMKKKLNTQEPKSTRAAFAL